MEKDAFAERKRAQEEDYFRKRENELVEKMRRKTELERERQKLAESTGITDETALLELQSLGFTPETTALLYIAPLVQVGWAEGTISAAERELIFAAARSHSIEEGSPAYSELSLWLNERPADDFFEKSLRLFKLLLRQLPTETLEARKSEVIANCTKVAEASGSLIGFLNARKRVSTEERDTLSTIVRELEEI
jgi:hypothetical protein